MKLNYINIALLYVVLLILDYFDVSLFEDALFDAALFIAAHLNVALRTNILICLFSVHNTVSL